MCDAPHLASEKQQVDECTQGTHVTQVSGLT
jgi:hypothetical protein